MQGRSTRSPRIVVVARGVLGVRPRSAPPHDARTMRKPLTFLGSFVGSYLGWYLGAQLGGMTTAFIVSMIGMGAGIYFGGRLAARLVD